MTKKTIYYWTITLNLVCTANLIQTELAFFGIITSFNKSSDRNKTVCRCDILNGSTDLSWHNSKSQLLRVTSRVDSSNYFSFVQEHLNDCSGLNDTSDVQRFWRRLARHSNLYEPLRHRKGLRFVRGIWFRSYNRIHILCS